MCVRVCVTTHMSTNSVRGLIDLVTFAFSLFDLVKRSYKCRIRLRLIISIIFSFLNLYRLLSVFHISRKIYSCHKAHSLHCLLPTQLIYLINPSLTLTFTLLWFDFGQLSPIDVFLVLQATR